MLAAALGRMGIHSVLQDHANSASVTFSLSQHGTLVYQVMPTPHPDRDRLLLGSAGPTAEQLSIADNHIVVVLMPTEEMDRAWIDRVLLQVTAAIAETSPSVAARIRGGVNYFRSDLFQRLVADIGEDQEPPVELVIGVRGGTEPDGRVSFLSSGLPRFGREDFLVTESAGSNQAMSMLWTMARWMIADPDKELPTGETLGRSAEERILIQRVPNPTADGSVVIRLDMP